MQWSLCHREGRHSLFPCSLFRLAPPSPAPAHLFHAPGSFLSDRTRGLYGSSRPMDDAEFAHHGRSARYPQCRRRSGMGLRNQRYGSSHGRWRLPLAGVRDSSGRGEAGFSGHPGLRRQHRHRHVVRQGGPLAPLQDDGWVPLVETHLHQSRRRRLLGCNPNVDPHRWIPGRRSSQTNLVFCRVDQLPEQFPGPGRRSKVEGETRRRGIRGKQFVSRARALSPEEWRTA